MSQEPEGSQGSRTRLRVGAFVLDVARETLIGPGGEVRLRSKTYKVLRYLLAHRRRIVTKQELVDAALGETSVTDDSLVQCLIEIRRALAISTTDAFRRFGAEATWLPTRLGKPARGVER